jgi:hypothetical protein
MQEPDAERALSDRRSPGAGPDDEAIAVAGSDRGTDAKVFPRGSFRRSHVRRRWRGGGGHGLGPRGRPRRLAAREREQQRGSP